MFVGMVLSVIQINKRQCVCVCVLDVTASVV
jgi:hypothetical protein